MSLFFRLEALCNECGKFIEMVAEGPYFNFTGQFVLKNDRLSNDTPLSQWDNVLCVECKQKKMEEE